MKSFERIKNFSTSIAVETTIAEIEKMLAKYGCAKIMKEYDGNGNVVALSFIVASVHGNLPIKLPLRLEKILDVFKIQVSNKKLPKKFWTGEWAEQQAGRVGWRIIRDWLDAQLTLLGIEMVKVEEIFLPYIYNPKTQKSLFEMLEERKFNVLQLTSDKQEDAVHNAEIIEEKP